MMAPWRLLAMGAAINLGLAVGGATAQTVIVRQAPPGSTIELWLNSATVGSVTASEGGLATLSFDLSAQLGKPETDANVYVDACENLRRVLLVEPGVELPPGGACVRRQVAGLYIVRPVTTMVVNVGESDPSLRLRQGPAPVAWLSDDPEAMAAERLRRPSPTGLVLFGAGGWSRFSNATDVACGNVTECKGNGFHLGYTGGAAFWVTRYLALEGTFLKPGDVVTRGGGESYRFYSSLDTYLFTLAGIGAIPVGPIRIYAKAGANYHNGSLYTSQTLDDRTVTVGGVEVVAGGTHTSGMETSGWGWLFGGGIEGWVAPNFAIYAEGTIAGVKGAPAEGIEGSMDDRATVILAGVRYRIGRKPR